MSKDPRRKTFIECYLNGQALADDIDEFIDAWHRSPGGQEIFEYLGMTREEYSAWLREPNILPYIASARRSNSRLSAVVRDAIGKLPIAARSSDSLKVKRLLRWLEQQGKIP